MISHLFIGIGDFDRALGFYKAIASVLGLRQRFVEPLKPWAAWTSADGARPYLIIGRPFDGGPATPGNGHMVALKAASRAEVDRAYAAALQTGGACEGPPRLRPQYHAHFYGAYVRDPDGNKLCICTHDPKEGDPS